MKRLLLVLASALLLSTAAATAMADGLGIDFGAMKRGTKVTYENSAGQKWVSTNVGKRGRYHRIDVRFIPDNRKARRRELYDTAGRLVRVEFPRNKSASITFKPYHCNRQPGACAMQSTSDRVVAVSRNKGKKLITRYSYKTARNGQKYTTGFTESKLGLDSKTFKSRVQSTKGRMTGTLTRYNLFSERTLTTGGKTHWTRIVRIEE